ncbi:uncharacterized protein METZ01_LOCUS159790 [marine metagenome]|uniref:Uncharacterized protein n=1 Tax=marine metagenome TaxID=408172 RepID=A0A382AZE5_9ZZZZ
MIATPGKKGDPGDALTPPEENYLIIIKEKIIE